VVLTSLGLRIPVYVSDRSRPSISYGRLQDILNPRVYRLAAGIIAQTERAKVFFERTTRHPNIGIIGNPIRTIHAPSHQRKNIILNVGRFIATKHQDWLVDYFVSINNPAWRLVFLGDGELLESVMNKARRSVAADRIEFLGNQKEIDRYYVEARIFAFTSTSEGFPNALGEAMAAGLACISFDCEAGPSDLIASGENGILISEEDHEGYRKALAMLMDDVNLCETMGNKAQQSMKRFETGAISEAFYRFITHHAPAD
jgi:GalNAc-alpha-(1->4)-GalNAc-alpha-(1->3)-diNAcBac-PP-undecaprenol alpha-1,4-N-acetyl-D-galactosaminyltransferase